MNYLEGLIRAEIDWGFLLYARIEMHRILKRASYASLYGSSVGVEIERDFMVMYLMGGEI